jgi:hypothetical protein
MEILFNCSMKKMLLLITAFLIGSNTFAQTDSVSCAAYHTGFFSYTDTTGNTIIVQRKKKYQYEKDIVTRVKTQDKIKWLNSCTYELTLVSSNSKAERKLKYSTFRIVITKADGSKGYVFSCACPDADKNKSKNYMKQLSKKEFFELY